MVVKLAGAWVNEGSSLQYKGYTGTLDAVTGILRLVAVAGGRPGLSRPESLTSKRVGGGNAREWSVQATGRARWPIGGLYHARLRCKVTGLAPAAGRRPSPFPELQATRRKMC